jgi:hypothetical protein
MVEQLREMIEKVPGENLVFRMSFGARADLQQECIDKGITLPLQTITGYGTHYYFDGIPIKIDTSLPRHLVYLTSDDLDYN